MNPRYYDISDLRYDVEKSFEKMERSIIDVIEEKDKEITYLTKENSQLQDEIAQLEKEIEELKFNKKFNELINEKN